MTEHKRAEQIRRAAYMAAAALTKSPQEIPWPVNLEEHKQAWGIFKLNKQYKERKLAVLKEIALAKLRSKSPPL